MTDTPRTNWQDRKFASHVHTRNWSAGWEFDTAAQACSYVNDQYAKTSADDRAHTPFRAEVKADGVYTHFWGGSYGAVVRKATYLPGDTMRDAKITSSPSDCFWMVPNTGHEG
jgi:hypothetical protein